MASNSDVDLVLRHLGNFGLYQFKVYVLSCLPIFIAGAITTALVFTTVVPSHRCFVEGCDLGSLNDRDVVGLQSYNDSFLKFTIPKVGNTEQLDSCRLNGRQDVTSFDLCLAQLFDNRTQNTCDEYVFEQSVFENTVVTEFNLVCSSSWIVQLLQSLFFVGILVGAIMSGIIADRHGRKTVFVFLCPTLLFTLFASSFAPSTLVYGLTLIVKGICVAGIYQSAFVIGIEFTGGRFRFWCGNISSIMFAIGAVYACIAADYFREWRFIEISLTFPVMIMLSYPCIFPESIRWQLSNGKFESAIEQILAAARTNSIVIPEELLASICKKQKIKAVHTKALSIIDLFTRHHLVRTWTLALLFIWFANSLTYYGLWFLSSQIDKNIFYSMTLLSLVEIPGIVLTAAFVEKFNRKSILVAVMLIGGVACTIAALLSPDYAQLKMWLAVLGKCTISGSFALIYVYTVEIFPTVLRISGLGLCSMFARIGGMTAPYLLQLTIFGPSFPFLTIGCVAIGAGLISTVLPETKGKKLPDTLEEVAMLKNGQSPHRQYDNRTSSSKSTNNEEEANLLGDET